MNIPERIAYLISKELRGTLLPSERTELDRWYAQRVQDEELDDLDVKWPKPRFQELKRRAGISQSKHRWLAPAGWAAAAALFIGLFLGNLFWFPPTDEPLLATSEPEYNRVENPLGVRRTILLSDSSSVYLNGGSVLYVHRKFSENRRLILEGEAFFDVKPDSIHPFVVSTRGLETTVLGTSFLVRAFEGEAQYIAVKSGKVSVAHTTQGDSKQELSVNEGLEIGLSSEFLEVKRINPSLTFAWVEGTIVFNDQPLSEVFAVLQRWYGLEELDIRRVNGNCRITGTYTQMTLKEILESIKYATQINYELKGKTLTVKNGNC